MYVSMYACMNLSVLRQERRAKECFNSLFNLHSSFGGSYFFGCVWVCVCGCVCVGVCACARARALLYKVTVSSGKQFSISLLRNNSLSVFSVSCGGLFVEIDFSFFILTDFSAHRCLVKK